MEDQVSPRAVGWSSKFWSRFANLAQVSRKRPADREMQTFESLNRHGKVSKFEAEIWRSSVNEIRGTWVKVRYSEYLQINVVIRVFTKQILQFTTAV